MKEQIIEILNDTRPEFNFAEENTDFIEKGMLDSFDIISLVSDLEERMGISIAGDKILARNFDSIEAIEKLLNDSK